MFAIENIDSSEYRSQLTICSRPA